MKTNKSKKKVFYTHIHIAHVKIAILSVKPWTHCIRVLSLSGCQLLPINEIFGYKLKPVVVSEMH